MGMKTMLVIAWGSAFKIVACLLTDENCQSCVELRSNFPNDAQGVDLTNPPLLLQHVVGHVGPV